MNSYFLSNFYNYLLNNDFFKIENNFSNNNIYFKNIGSNGYIVAPIFKSEENYENYFNTLEQNCRLFLKKHNLSKMFIFKILISDNFLEEDINFLNCELNLDDNTVNIVWGVDLLNKKIITKANQPTKFLDIEKYITMCMNNNLSNVRESLKPKNYILSKNTYITYSLIFILILVHMIINMSFDKSYVIYNYGVSPNLLEDKQFYRLITFLFLHSGVTHLLSNILSLYIFGTRIEKYLGKLAFCLIFLIGGLSSGIFSVLFTKSYSIGASGAIFALESATLYFSIKEKIKLDGLDYYTIGIFSIIGILASFTDSSIDNAGHIGGFIMGIIICYIYYKTIYKKYKNNL